MIFPKIVFFYTSIDKDRVVYINISLFVYIYIHTYITTLVVCKTQNKNIYTFHIHGRYPMISVFNDSTYCFGTKYKYTLDFDVFPNCNAMIT